MSCLSCDAPSRAATARRVATLPTPLDLDDRPPVDDAKATELPRDLAEDLRPPLAPEDAWIASVDFDAFGRDVRKRDMGEEDLRHLEKISTWRNLCAALGLATVWTDPNPLTIAALSMWTYASWTIIGHLACACREAATS